MCLVGILSCSQRLQCNRYFDLPKTTWDHFLDHLKVFFQITSDVQDDHQTLAWWFTNVLAMSLPHTSFSSSLFFHGQSCPFLITSNFIAISYALTVICGLSFLSCLAAVFFPISWKMFIYFSLDITSIFSLGKRYYKYNSSFYSNALILFIYVFHLWKMCLWLKCDNALSNIYIYIYVITKY